jgi:hypothetical protein
MHDFVIEGLGFKSRWANVPQCPDMSSERHTTSSYNLSIVCCCGGGGGGGGGNSLHKRIAGRH